MGVLAAQNWFSYQRKPGQQDHVRKLTSSLSTAPVDLRVFLAQTTISVNDLLNLQPGDLLTTEKDQSREVLVQVEGRNKFLGRIGQFKGNRAIQITRVCQQPAETVLEKKSS
jgi:flagellar motor switch protein FliM